MFTFKPKKVFEKMNKMNRKQAYTIGAIAVVLVVALLLLLSSVGSEDDSFAGMKARGYDLAQMPFATDAAEKYLLANAYPDMQENGSSLLYTAAEKEKRQELDAAAIEEAADDSEEETSGADSGDNSYSSGSRGYGGYSGGGRGGGSGSKTVVNQLSNSGMASAGGSGVNSTWGPSGDFRQFKGREDKGKEKPLQLKTDNARLALAQFRSGSHAGAGIKQNKALNASKALFGGNIQGSDAFGKNGVDGEKLKEAGLTLDTSAPATTTDLENLDKKVADKVNDADKPDDKKKKKEWWEEMLIDLAKSSAKLVVDSFLGTAMDTLTANISANHAARKAKNAVFDAKSEENYILAQGDTPEGIKIREAACGRGCTAEQFKQKYSKPSNYYEDGRKYLESNDLETVKNANKDAEKRRTVALGQSHEAASERRAIRLKQEEAEEKERLEKLKKDKEQSEQNGSNIGKTEAK